MSKVVGDIAISVDAETEGLIKGLQSGKVSVQDFGTKIEQMGKRINAAEAKTRSAGGAFRRLGNVSNRTRAQIQNTSFQLQDIAVQLQGGTRASTVFAQQLPQLAGAFGPVGAVMGVLAGVGIPALAFAFGDLGQEADELAEKLKNVEEVQKRLSAELRQEITGKSAEELAIEEAIAATKKEIVQLQGAMNQRSEGAVQIAKQQHAAAVQSLADLQEQLVRQKQLQSARERFNASTQQTADQERLLGEQMGVTGRNLAENEAIARLLRDGLSASAIEALQLAGVDMVTGIDAAAKAAAQMAANLNISLQQALQLRAMATAPLNEFGGAGPTINHDLKPFVLNPVETGGGGGGGSGGGSGDATEAELEALRLKYATEQELLDINLQTTLEKLAAFREAKKISEDEANSLELAAKKEHEDAMSKLERDAQQARLQSVSGALGDLASLMQSGNDKLHKIGKAAAIADAVVSGYGAAVSAWEKGMKIGGPPVAAAFTAASLAKTASLISGIQSSSSTGGSQAATSSGGDVATPTREVQVAEFRFLGDTVSTASLIEAINQAEEQGYTIRGSLA